ncbi:hypothetical protein EV424DRAFT_1435008 [Suillus variegatus]|nr:hypothetical protein EV424DRAFT_1435008 [Suillus variegatus]
MGLLLAIPLATFTASSATLPSRTTHTMPQRSASSAPIIRPVRTSSKGKKPSLRTTCAALMAVFKLFGFGNLLLKPSGYRLDIQCTPAQSAIFN